jgi:hypothetical protein
LCLLSPPVRSLTGYLEGYLEGTKLLFSLNHLLPFSPYPSGYPVKMEVKRENAKESKKRCLLVAAMQMFWMGTPGWQGT